MIRKLDIKDIAAAKSVLELQRASYKVEAGIIGFLKLPPLMDTIESLVECDEIFYGYYIDDTLAGIISYKVIENVLDLHRVAVYPVYFRRGIADKLVSFVEGLENNINKAKVCTGKENLPAVNLYIKKGYKKVSDIEISKGIYITEFEKVL